MLGNALIDAQAIRENLGKTQLRLSDVCIDGSSSTVSTDQEFLETLLDDPVSFDFHRDLDDVFDRLLEERLNSVGHALVFRKFLIAEWEKNELSMTQDWLLRDILNISGSAKDEESPLRKFSTMELLELNYWISQNALQAWLETGSEDARRYVDPQKSLVAYLSHGLTT